MKEKYYTADNLDHMAAEFLDFVNTILHKTPNAAMQTKVSALLVLDMQRYFLEEDSHAFIPSANTILRNINRLQEAFFHRNRPVIQTRHINNSKNAGRMKSQWRDLIRDGDPYSEISGSIRDSRARQLVKHSYDAFYETDLEKILLESGVNQLVITGVMTHLCCESTARSAFMRGFEVFFVVDATATYNRQFHQASLLNLSHGFAVPFKTRAILTAFSGGTK